MHIVFYGPEGCGKGTQAAILGEKLHIPVLTSGDLVRDAAANDKGHIGDVCRAALSGGGYVADQEMYVLWEKRLGQDDAKKGWIMDGFPRNIEQAKFLTAKIASFGYSIDRVFHLSLTEEESMKRLIKRARPLHPGSKELHDSPERIAHRLRVYKSYEKPLLDYYTTQGILTTIDASRSIEDVKNDITRVIDHE